MNESSLAQLLASAHTAEMAVRAVGHGLQALDHRLAHVEQQAADLRALAAFLAARPARRGPERVTPVHRMAA